MSKLEEAVFEAARHLVFIPGPLLYDQFFSDVRSGWLARKSNQSGLSKSKKRLAKRKATLILLDRMSNYADLC